MTRVAALMTVAALALCGCGATSLSANQLRSQAARLCTATTRQINRIPTPTSPAGGAQFLRIGLAALTPELQALRTLRPPGDLAHDYSTALTTTARELAALHSTLRVLEGGGDPVILIKALQRRLRPLEARANGAWRALKIDACVNR